jgi:hypothetical protein
VNTDCPACGSKRLVRWAHVATRVWRREVALYGPGGFLALGHDAGGIRATACVECGNIQLFAKDLETLRLVYEQQPTPLIGCG